jgi:hypothetical protein
MTTNTKVQRRVLVHRINGNKRPYIIPYDLKGSQGRYYTDERAEMSETDWENERIRRINAIRVLTPDERHVMREYWELRDG